MIIQGDCLHALKGIRDETVDCCITSPPYYALRDYKVDGNIWDADLNCNHDWITDNRKLENHNGLGNRNVGDCRSRANIETIIKNGFCSKCNAWKGQLGLESTFELYLNHLIQIFTEVKRVLKRTGTCWVVMGDTYGGAGYGQKDTGKHGYDPSVMATMKDKPDTKNMGIPDKSLLMIPSRFAIKMIDSGWILRNDIIWYKPNCMPSSAKDRFTVDYEHIFFFTKDKKYYFKTQYEPFIDDDSRNNKRKFGVVRSRIYNYNSKYNQMTGPQKNLYKGNNKGEQPHNPLGRIKRTVWKIAPKPFPEAHFAVFPEELVKQCIDPGCPSEICIKCDKPITLKYKLGDITSTGGGKKGAEGHNSAIHINNRHDYPPEGMSAHEPIFDGYNICNCNAGFKQGTVLDPFMGAGTVPLVALKTGRQFIGIEINKDYIEIAKKRITPYLLQTKLIME